MPRRSTRLTAAPVRQRRRAPSGGRLRRARDPRVRPVPWPSWFLPRFCAPVKGRQVRRLSAIADHIETLEDDYVDLTDAELRALTDTFRERLADGETLDDLLPEAFAVVREAARRTLGQFHYKVQLMGGAALHLGNVAEMKTGEGKTLVSTLPAYLNALPGKGVHVVTVNDYLASRDADWMGRVHRFLGLTVGKILNDLPPEKRRAAYNADITYGTNNEFGFDYLRDNMAWSLDDLVQRGHDFAVVDEVDSILIDEARTPLIISGPAEENQRWYLEFARMAPRMKRDAALRGRRGQAHRRRHRGGRRVRRGPARHREPLRGRQHAAGRLPEQRAEGQGAVQARPRLHRQRRRRHDRRRVHRPRAARPALQRGHAPGHRGQGRRADPAGEPDAGHDHAAELLPPLREARPA